MVKEALKEARKNLREEKRTKEPSSPNSIVMANLKRGNQKLCKPHSASKTCEEAALQ
jgi:hypothetical protein